MHVSNLDNFNNDDRVINQKLNELFEEWYESSKNKAFGNELTPEDLCFDGIYPNYSSMKTKILYIGREALGISGENYINVLFNAIKENKIGKQHINSHKFHNRMIYLTYAFNKDFPEWVDIPFADKLTSTFGEKDGISYGFMNLSKLSNDSGAWQLDGSLFESFVEAFAESNYFSREIEIIDPDIIITMNLGDHLDVLGSLEEISREQFVTTYKLKVNEKEILLFDTYHFSYTKLNDITELYAPLKQSFFKNNQN